jgi:hypothetical protein
MSKTNSNATVDKLKTDKQIAVSLKKKEELNIGGSVLTMSESDYPYFRVMGFYALLGGIFGGVALDLSMVIISLITQNSIETFMFQRSVEWFFRALLFVGIMGFLPALLTGFIACLFKIYFDSIKKAVLLFIIGFVSTFIYMVLFTLDKDFIDVAVMLFLFCCNGGAIAVIIGWFVLPKHK